MFKLPLRRTRWTLRLLALIPLVSLFWMMGCAQDLPDINRTQPRGVEKLKFRATNDDGSLREWYFRQTVIEVPYGSGSTFVGEQGNTEKIVWEITELFLYAYRSREYVKNTDAPAQRPDTEDHKGSAVAAFRIESHFDVQRSYNPATGEQTNVIVENMSDRPWYERKYMRVDFSQNLVTDFTFVASSVKAQPISYYIAETEVNNKDRANITDNYMDVVHKMHIQPELDELYSSYFGRPIPSCWLYTSITKDCSGQTIKIRSSFMLAKKTGYTKKEYSNNRMDKFGFFRQTNYTYNRGYGVLEDTTSRVIQRWNIWENESSCAKPGEMLSHANCKVKHIPYYVNELFPEELKSSTAEVFQQWNKNFAEVVKKRSGKDQGDIFIFCPNNPVKQGDPEVCGKEGLSPQIGDLRYSFIYWVARPHRSSPLGYGPSASDPITGEVFNANSFIYGAALDSYANYATDLVRLVNGDVEGERLALGQQLLAYHKNMKGLLEHTHDHHHKLSQTSNTITKNITNLKAIGDRLRKRAKDGRASFDWASANLKRLANNPNNAAVLAGDPFKAFGLGFLSPSGQINQKILDHYGPHRLASREFLKWSRDRMTRLSKRNVFMSDFLDDGILSRAQKMKDMFRGDDGKVDYKKVYEKLRADIYLAVTLHEVGHNMGLRHNFAGSADAINYHDQYWKLRAETVIQGDRAPRPFYKYTGLDGVKLRSAIEKGMHEFQYSSIMDYGAGFASDLHGLGKYDRAAILYGYGDLVEVFKDGSTVLSPQQAKQQLSPGTWHYTELPRVIAGNGKDFTQQIKSLTLDARRIVGLEELSKNSNLVEVPYRFCSDEYHQGASDCNRFDQGADPYERVFDMAQRYWSYYIFNAFKRGRVEFGLNIDSYMARIYDRYFLPITHQYKHFVNNGLIIRSGQTCGQNGGPWYGDDRCGNAGFVAAVHGLNFFYQVMQTPDAGCYRRSTSGSSRTFQHISDGACPRTNGKVADNHLEVPLGKGRMMLSSYDKESNGYEFYWKPNNFGAWWDKYMAVMALGDPYTRFLGVDNSGNARSFLINYSNLFGRYVNNIVGAFLAGKPESYGPVVSSSGSTLTMSFRNAINIAGAGFDPVPSYGLSPSLDPNEQYTAKLLVGFLAAVYFSGDTDDQSLNESLKISVRGRSESPEVPESVRKDPSKYVEIVDPGSQRIYYAAKVNTSRNTFNVGPSAFSSGYEMLMSIKNRFYEPDGKTLKSGVDIETVHSEFHYINIVMGWLNAGEYNRPRGF